MLLHPVVRSGWILSVSVLHFDLTGEDSWEPLLASHSFLDFVLFLLDSQECSLPFTASRLSSFSLLIFSPYSRSTVACARVIVVVKLVLALLPLFFPLASQNKKKHQLGCLIFICYDHAKY